MPRDQPCWTDAYSASIFVQRSIEGHRNIRPRSFHDLDIQCSVCSGIGSFQELLLLQIRLY